MCSCCRNNKNPQTVKLSPRSSGQNPTWPICKQSNADAPKPPTYPFSHQLFKERSTRQKFQGALISSASSKALSSDFPDCRDCVCRRFFPSPSLFVSVRRYLRMTAGTRKGKKRGRRIFFTEAEYHTKSCGPLVLHHHRRCTAARLVLHSHSDQAVCDCRAFGVSRTASNAPTAPA